MPKRVNDIFIPAITFRKLLEAHNKTKKGKRFKKQVIEFEMDMESNIIQIEKELLNGTYKFSKYFEFKIYEPKERIIKTLKYRDRVVQTWYVENFLKPYFAVSFISDSFACIEDKGTHKAANQMQKYLRKADKEYEETWVLKCDISKFFFNIDCEILYKIIERKIKDREFLEFTKKILYTVIFSKMFFASSLDFSNNTKSSIYLSTYFIFNFSFKYLSNSFIYIFA